MRKGLLFLLFFFQACFVFADDFNNYLHQGKWANAKLCLIRSRTQTPSLQYFINHIKLSTFLHEQELSKAYCDSLRLHHLFSSSPIANAFYQINISKYYQYHVDAEKAYRSALSGLEYARSCGDRLLILQAQLQVGNALRIAGDPVHRKSRILHLIEATNGASTLPDSLFLYKAKLLQTASLSWIDDAGASATAGDFARKLLEKSNAIIQAHYSEHPQVIHNNLLLGLISLKHSTDEALSYYRKADMLLNKLNDNGRGILIHLNTSLYHLMDGAYELKYNETKNEDFLNKAILCAKQNLRMDQYKQQYEGFYFYRRYIDRYNTPTEQRITNLYFKLYTKTNNKNYLNFAMKYAEYFRHKPISQAGIKQTLYGTLAAMAKIENGHQQGYDANTDYFSNLITQPEYISALLKKNEAVIAYFCYNNHQEDSVTFLVQCIEGGKQEHLIFSIGKATLGNLPSRIFSAVETNQPALYQEQALLGYRLLLKPAIDKLGSGINKLFIIPPAYFSKPLLFEGFVTNSNGHSFEEFNYVFDRYNVSYITSFTHFSMHQEDVKVNQVNIWSPDYSKSSLAEITESGKIAQNISRYFKTRNITYKTKSQLTENMLNSEVLQISAHASASFEELERPKIYTALMNEDSVLYDIDLEQLTAGNSLAVFAACKSNVGNIQHNGMIDGFTRATLSAGGAGTICTVYNVEESITTELLDQFYMHLSKGNTPADALYLAKKSIKLKNGNPKIWQAFIYTGSDQTFISSKKETSVYYFWISLLIFTGTLVMLIKAELY